MNKCKHCKIEYDITDKPKGWMANHSRWCNKNPKRSEYVNTNSKRIIEMKEAKRRNGFTNQFTKSKLLSIPIPDGPLKGTTGYGTFNGKTHTESSKQTMREKALASNHRRLKKGVIEYKGILLDSSWELALAKRLDELQIKWIRPNPIPWVDEQGITHNYFADFYLSDYNLFLDPKNPYAIKSQKKKLKMLLRQYTNIIILESIEECESFNI